MELRDFYRLHNKQTCLIAGLGPNLRLTPPDWFNYPTFGINTIYKQTEWDWKPTYYVGVDDRLKIEDGQAVCKAYVDVPKFFPSPDFDDLPGENVYRFKHRQNGELFVGGQSPLDIQALTEWGITYRRIMDAVFQIAAWMGFTTMLMIGVQHKAGTRKQLVWGVDENEPEADFIYEEMGYVECRRALSGVRVLNISEDTYVPDSIIPRGDWREWVATEGIKAA